MSRHRDVDLNIGRWRRNGSPMPIGSLDLIAADYDDGAARVPNPTMGQQFAAGLHADGTADVTCWCERLTVRVPLDDVAAGFTRTCGTARCYSIAETVYRAIAPR